MGMFDSFYFKKGVLPDNKVPEDHEFQTKSLDRDMDTYDVDSNGHVKKFQLWHDGKRYDNSPINCEADIYSYEFLYDNEKDLLKRKYLGCKYQEYKIIIVNSKIVHVEKTHESGYDAPSL